MEMYEICNDDSSTVVNSNTNAKSDNNYDNDSNDRSKTAIRINNLLIK